MTGPYACTIATRDRLAHARVLTESFLACHPGASVTVLVVDDPDEETGEGEPFEVLRPTEVGLTRRAFHDLAFLCSQMELSTSLKAPLLRTLLDRGYPSVFYLDSDLWFHAPIDDLDPAAAGAAVVLTPHRMEPAPLDRRQVSDRAIALAGTINTGFVAVSQRGRGLLDWWWERLADQWYTAPEDARSSDQQYLDLAPTFFDATVVGDPAVNVGYWNADVQRIEWTGTDYQVQGKPLRFFHFSGFDPHQSWLLSRNQGPRPRVLLSDQPALARLCSEYARALLDRGYAAASVRPYGYEHLPDGVPIDERMRRLYREALTSDESPPPDPFDRERPSGLTEWLNDPVDASGISRYLLQLVAERPLSQRAFPDLSGADGPRFLAWVREQGHESEHLPPELIPRPDQPLRKSRVPRPEATPPGVNVVGFLGTASGLGACPRRRLEHGRPAQLSEIS